MPWLMTSGGFFHAGTMRSTATRRDIPHQVADRYDPDRPVLKQACNKEVAISFTAPEFDASCPTT